MLQILAVFSLFNSLKGFNLSFKVPCNPSGWIVGFVYYNFIRLHLSLKSKTPAEAYGIDLKNRKRLGRFDKRGYLLSNQIDKVYFQ